MHHRADELVGFLAVLLQIVLGRQQGLDKSKRATRVMVPGSGKKPGISGETIFWAGQPTGTGLL
jgi:hypothetical protein